MAEEIEKKYLIREGFEEYPTEAFKQNFFSVDYLARKILEEGEKIRQGYLELDKGINLAKLVSMNIDFVPQEARLRDKEGKFFFTVKGNGGLLRLELEQEINSGLFNDFWPETEKRRIEKMRLKKPYKDYDAEFDIYLDRNLIIAEVEVPSIEKAEKLIPLGRDVTDDKNYKNKNLAR
jgi:CYTH domain-containing protein